MKKLNVKISEEASSFIEPLAEHLSAQLNITVTKENVIGIALRELYEKEFSVSKVIS